MSDPFSDRLLENDPVGSDGTTVAYTRTSGRVTQITWTDTASSLLMKKVVITRAANGQATQIDTYVYEQDGVTVDAHKIDAYTRTGGVVTGDTVTRPT